MITDNEIKKLIIAICTNTELRLQVIKRIEYSSQSKMTRNRYSLEFLIKGISEDEDGNRKRINKAYKTEHFKNLNDLYVRLGNLYKENVVMGGDG